MSVMTHTLYLIGGGAVAVWAATMIFVVALCRAAATGDRALEHARHYWEEVEA